MNLWLALAFLFTSEAAEYRKLTLSNGRTIYAEMQNSTTEGLSVTLSQGDMFIPFSIIQELQPIEFPTLEANAAWSIIVLPAQGGTPTENERAISNIITEFNTIPAISLSTPATECSSIACAKTMQETTGAEFVFLPTIDGDDLTLQTVFIGSQEPYEGTRVRNYQTDTRAINSSLYHAMGLISPLPPVTTAPPVVESQPTVSTPSRPLVWVPIPGITAAAEGDWGRFAKHLGIGVVGSAAMIHMVGRSAFTDRQFLALGTASTVILSVSINLGGTNNSPPPPTDP